MKRHELPLEEKIQLIKDNNGGLGMSVRKVVQQTFDLVVKNTKPIILKGTKDLYRFCFYVF